MLKGLIWGDKLLHEEREPCLKIGVTSAIFKLSGNMPCLSDKFMSGSSRNISSAAEDYKSPCALS